MTSFSFLGWTVPFRDNLHCLAALIRGEYTIIHFSNRLSKSKWTFLRGRQKTKHSRPIWQRYPESCQERGCHDAVAMDRFVLSAHLYLSKQWKHFNTLLVFRFRCTGLSLDLSGLLLSQTFLWIMSTVSVTLVSN